MSTDVQGKAGLRCYDVIGHESKTFISRCNGKCKHFTPDTCDPSLQVFQKHDQLKPCVRPTVNAVAFYSRQLGDIDVVKDHNLVARYDYKPVSSASQRE